MTNLTLLGLCGSLARHSTNRNLMMEAVRAFNPTIFVDADMRFPLYDKDIQAEEGIPSAVQTLADQIAVANAVIVASPEYNKGVPGGLKNALDWVSRTDGNPWMNKPVAIMSATAGRSGGERVQTMLASCLHPFRPRLVCGPEVLVGDTANQWNEHGALTNERNLKALSNLMAALRSEAEARA